jgi:hypothetical protein
VEAAAATEVAAAQVAAQAARGEAEANAGASAAAARAAADAALNTEAAAAAAEAARVLTEAAALVTAATAEAYRVLHEARNGHVVVLYNTYKDPFQLVEGRLTAAAIDDEYCLTDAMPGCQVRYKLGAQPSRGLVCLGTEPQRRVSRRVYVCTTAGRTLVCARAPWVCMCLSANTHARQIHLSRISPAEFTQLSQPSEQGPAFEVKYEREEPWGTFVELDARRHYHVWVVQDKQVRKMKPLILLRLRHVLMLEKCPLLLTGSVFSERNLCFVYVFFGGRKFPSF